MSEFKKLKEQIMEKIEYELSCIYQWNNSEKTLHAAQAVECLVNAYREIDKMVQKEEMEE